MKKERIPEVIVDVAAITTDDRRSCPRVPGDFPVRVGWGDVREEGTGCDLGTGGISCVLARGPDVATLVDLDIVLPPRGGNPRRRGVSCRGRVLRADTTETGARRLAIAFVDIPPGERVELDEYVADLASHPPVSQRVRIEDPAFEPQGFSGTCSCYIPLFHELSLTCNLPDGSEVACTAMVVKCERARAQDPYEVVLFFLDPPDEGRARLASHFPFSASSV
ncbi:MAG TPA: PilZ domain-containing protein [bacterium]|nr:PilZ domain-containing protein [bacterium]HPJ72631.1 PilZ domain-containing protein [bacterium]HPQ65552.1 PilZ domain-containing protein [bacterium]